MVTAKGVGREVGDCKAAAAACDDDDDDDDEDGDDDDDAAGPSYRPKLPLPMLL